MLWLCIHLPQLPVEIFLQPGSNNKSYGSNNTDRPVLICEHQRVVYCNQNALQQGIKPGLAIATATALTDSTVSVMERSPHQEQQTLEFIATLCYRFSPLIVVCPPFNVLLDLSGCLKLHHGLQVLQQAIDKLLSELAYSYQLGLANTPKAATLLALGYRSLRRADQHFPHFDYQDQRIIHSIQEQQIAEQNLSHLPASQKLRNKWQKLGFKQLAELQALPAAAIGKRFGKDFLLYLQQLRDERADPQQGIVIAQTFSREQHFLDGINNSEQLLFSAKRLLNEFSQYLSTRQLCCHHFCWQLQQQSRAGEQQHIEISIPLTQAQNNVTNFLALTRLKLEHTPLQSAVETIRLESSEFSPAEQQSISLFSELDNDPESIKQFGAVNSDAYQQLLDRLCTRLGENALMQLSYCDEHLPEFSFHLSPVVQNCGGKTTKRPGIPPSPPINNQAGKIRPLFLFANARTLQARKDGLYWQGKMYLTQGPERIESRWWQDYGARDYYLAQHESGSVYWIYQDLQKQRWYVQGIFS